jgi:hypothetical protein
MAEAKLPPVRSLAPDWAPPDIDTSVAHPAQIYDYFLGGKNHFAVDRETAEATLRIVPELRAIARANRAFLARTVQYLAEAGITQYLDLGTGLPSPGDVAEVARAVRPETRIVYVDSDPIVASHIRAALASADPKLTAVVHADVREPETILRDQAVRAVLDFEQPVAVLLLAVLHFVRDDEDPASIVKAFTDAAAPGSHLVVSHGTDDFETDRARDSVRVYKATVPLVLRDHAAISGLFAGVDVVEPGVVPITEWHPDGELVTGPVFYGGVGVKR